jgi:hypothetical protein
MFGVQKIDEQSGGDKKKKKEFSEEFSSFRYHKTRRL